MPTITTTPDAVTLELSESESETYDWANRSGAAWPCSEIAGHGLAATFDRTGLVELDSSRRDDAGGSDFPADEFNAITSDFLRDALPKSHPAYFAAVGQFA